MRKRGIKDPANRRGMRDAGEREDRRAVERKNAILTGYRVICFAAHDLSSAETNTLLPCAEYVPSCGFRCTAVAQIFPNYTRTAKRNYKTRDQDSAKPFRPFRVSNRQVPPIGCLIRHPMTETRGCTGRIINIAFPIFIRVSSVRPALNPCLG